MILHMEQSAIDELNEYIKQEKFKAVKEFAEKVYEEFKIKGEIGKEVKDKFNEYTKSIIDKLLKEYTQCPTCKGKGSAYDDEVGIETCPDCRGKGEIR